MLPLLFARYQRENVGDVAAKIVPEEETRIVIADGADSRSPIACVESIWILISFDSYFFKERLSS